MIDLYSWPAPNGHKIHILLEELEVPFRIIPINITAGDQHQRSYRTINPNGKIPAIVDHAPLDGGAPHTVFETGAILQYLAEKEERFLPTDPRQRSEVLQWLFWQVGGLGPMMGQAQHFFRYASTPVPYAIERYQIETRRLLRILNDRLKERDYVCDAYSIVDMACFPWIRIHKMTGISLDEFPAVRAWYGRMRARPAVGRALELLRDRWVDVTTSAEAKHNLFQKTSY
ncbi:glutathione S-transferase N-terminal domain-containing protein [Cupriavidus consociatus]|uniref:glutathione S-transferase N-terminal domain-containing protein n=1 Tax=Cupriavidus consociatus TaxID=2821357 RepID=UPI001AE9089B|nr:MULTISPECIES: glutathione S-transferase N-terminal domain-containing protein [unclassified Cupriavidus]MBP0621160.1 glutathione S-transferase N-terminal domain-containing protein [Cupriavidus sp. LEh25]MDK2657830.1 glutathione S-transferase N-terminal domain-containing protein [Cupriavidus sp. LEh21]